MTLAKLTRNAFLASRLTLAEWNRRIAISTFMLIEWDNMMNGDSSTVRYAGRTPLEARTA